MSENMILSVEITNETNKRTEKLTLSELNTFLQSNYVGALLIKKFTYDGKENDLFLFPIFTIDYSVQFEEKNGRLVFQTYLHALQKENEEPISSEISISPSDITHITLSKINKKT
jgi:hypothetical protein